MHRYGQAALTCIPSSFSFQPKSCIQLYNSYTKSKILCITNTNRLYSTCAHKTDHHSSSHSPTTNDIPLISRDSISPSPNANKTTNTPASSSSSSPSTSVSIGLNRRTDIRRSACISHPLEDILVDKATVNHWIEWFRETCAHLPVPSVRLWGGTYREILVSTLPSPLPLDGIINQIKNCALQHDIDRYSPPLLGNASTDKLTHSKKVLPVELLLGLTRSLRITHLLPLQQVALPLLLQQQTDVLLAAPAASGKSVAAAVALLHSLCYDEWQPWGASTFLMGAPPGLPGAPAGKGRTPGSASGAPELSSGHRIRAVVVTPTRDMAMQTRSMLISAGMYLPLRVGVLTGRSAGERGRGSANAWSQFNRLVAERADVLICTPGKVEELIQFLLLVKSRKEELCKDIHHGLANILSACMHLIIEDASLMLSDPCMLQAIAKLKEILPTGHKCILLTSSLSWGLNSSALRLLRVNSYCLNCIERCNYSYPSLSPLFQMYSNQCISSNSSSAKEEEHIPLSMQSSLSNPLNTTKCDYSSTHIDADRDSNRYTWGARRDREIGKEPDKEKEIDIKRNGEKEIDIRRDGEEVLVRRCTDRDVEGYKEKEIDKVTKKERCKETAKPIDSETDKHTVKEKGKGSAKERTKERGEEREMYEGNCILNSKTPQQLWGPKRSYEFILKKKRELERIARSVSVLSSGIDGWRERGREGGACSITQEYILYPPELHAHLLFSLMRREAVAAAAERRQLETAGLISQHRRVLIFFNTTNCLLFHYILFKHYLLPKANILMQEMHALLKDNAFKANISSYVNGNTCGINHMNNMNGNLNENNDNNSNRNHYCYNDDTNSNNANTNSNTYTSIDNNNTNKENIDIFESVDEWRGKYVRIPKVYALHSKLSLEKRRSIVESFRSEEMEDDEYAEKTRDIIDNESLSKQKDKNRFKSNNTFLKILLCTDVAAVGVQLGRPALVLQIGAPKSVELYVQRASRAPRWAKSLIALSDLDCHFLYECYKENIPLREASARESLSLLRADPFYSYCLGGRRGIFAYRKAVERERYIRSKGEREIDEETHRSVNHGEERDINGEREMQTSLKVLADIKEEEERDIKKEEETDSSIATSPPSTTSCTSSSASVNSYTYASTLSPLSYSSYDYACNDLTNSVIASFNLMYRSLLGHYAMQASRLKYERWQVPSFVNAMMFSFGFEECPKVSKQFAARMQLLNAPGLGVDYNATTRTDLLLATLPSCVGFKSRYKQIREGERVCKEVDEAYGWGEREDENRVIKGYNDACKDERDDRSIKGDSNACKDISIYNEIDKRPLKGGSTACKDISKYNKDRNCSMLDSIKLYPPRKLWLLDKRN